MTRWAVLLAAVVSLGLPSVPPSAAGWAAGAYPPANPEEAAEAIAYPSIDLDAAIPALIRDRAYLLPGAPVWFDVERVGLATAGTNLVVVATPPEPRLHDPGWRAYVRMISPLESWVTRRGLRMLVVDGPQIRDEDWDLVRMDSQELRLALQTGDVTGPVLSMVAAHGGVPDRDGSPPVRFTEPDPVLVSEVVTGLRGSRFYRAPGATERVRPEPAWQELNPDLPLRVAVLPADEPGAPLPDLLPVLAEEFPGELVVLVTGRWFEAASTSDPDTVTPHVPRAQGYVLGVWEDWLTDPLGHGSEHELGEFVWAFLERLGALRDGSYLERPQLQPAPPRDVGATVARWAPWVFLGMAVLLGGPALGLWSVRNVRGLRAEAAEVAVGRAEVLAELAALGATLYRTKPGKDKRHRRRLAAAAERYQTARTLFAHADTPEEVEVVRRTAREATAALRGSRSPGRGPQAAAAGPAAARGRRLRWGALVRTGRHGRFRQALWAGALLAAGAAVFLTYLALPTESRRAGQLASPAVAELRGSAVYVGPAGAGAGSVDPDQVRRVVGDRPIAVAIFGEVGVERRGPLCDEIVEVLPDIMVMTFVDGKWGGCQGAGFPDAADGFLYLWGHKLHVSAERTTELRYAPDHPDPLAFVEEFVLAFDFWAPRDLPDQIVARQPVPDPLAAWQIALALVAVAAGTAAAFVGLAVAARLLARMRGRRWELAGEHAALRADLSRVAARLLKARPGPATAEAAEHYLAAMHQFARARTAAELREVTRTVREAAASLDR